MVFMTARNMLSLVFVAFVVCSTIGESLGSSSECGGPTTINYIYSRDREMHGEPHTAKGNVLQGRPGRFGPPGPKGEKGAPGVREDTLRELKRLQKELNEVRSELVTFRVYSSCDVVPGGSGRRNGIYWINPAPERIQPFQVFCNFSGASPDTIIRHDSTDELRFSGCEPNFCYKRTINYSATLKQIVSLIEVSEECRQFIKLRCVGVLLNHVNSDTRSSAWVSRGGQQELYWGGATSRRPNYCACGETRSCSRSQDRCNCDRNDLVERSDEGFLTDKQKLPVIELQFGDAGDRGEVGWHTLGPLICSGRQ